MTIKCPPIGEETLATVSRTKDHDHDAAKARCGVPKMNIFEQLVSL